MKPQSKKRALSKNDYRVGKESHKRRVNARNAIRRTLKDGKKTFKNLLVETHLSRPGLSSNLKEMYEKREVTRDTDPKDWRRSYYSMTPTGWDEYRKQRDVESLNSMEFLRIGYMMGAVKALVMDFIKAYEVGVESAYPEGIPQLGEEGKTILKECLTLSFYSEPLENKRVRPMQALTELIQSVNALATSKNVDLRHLKQIPNLTVVFGFNRDKLIEEYLKKTGAA